MIPIAVVSDELIIGDVRTGKRPIAIDAINQPERSGIKCVYVAIGQKQSTIAKRRTQAGKQRRDEQHHRGPPSFRFDPAARAVSLAPLRRLHHG